jgi:hypothetical protein
VTKLCTFRNNARPQRSRCAAMFWTLYVRRGGQWEITHYRIIGGPRTIRDKRARMDVKADNEGISVNMTGSPFCDCGAMAKQRSV